MGGLSWWHWVIIIAAFILIFGAKKLPDAARGVGRSLRILKSEVSAMHEDDDNDKPTKPAGETDASAAVATPPAQIAASPVTPSAPAQPQQPPVQQQPAQQQVPVVNGVPASRDYQQST